jgi:hypothetical protein
MGRSCVHTLQRIHMTARRARELAAEFRTDLPMRDALMAYAVEIEAQGRERLGTDRDASGLDDGLTADGTLSDAASPSEYWRRECAFLRERMLSLMPSDDAGSSSRCPTSAAGWPRCSRRAPGRQLPCIGPPSASGSPALPPAARSRFRSRPAGGA